MSSQRWKEDACPHSPPAERTFVSNIFIQMGLTKSSLQPGVAKCQKKVQTSQRPSHGVEPLKAVVHVTIKEVTRNCKRKPVDHGSISGFRFYSSAQKY